MSAPNHSTIPAVGSGPTFVRESDYDSLDTRVTSLEGGGGGGGSGSGGGGYVQAPILTDSAGRWWAMSVTPDGALKTIKDVLYGTAYNPGYGPCLADGSGQYWQLAVDPAGELSTTSVTPTSVIDPTFDNGNGPVFYTARNTGWRLGVTTDGALATTSL